jgi:hypothetical protein
MGTGYRRIKVFITGELETVQQFQRTTLESMLNDFTRLHPNILTKTFFALNINGVFVNDSILGIIFYRAIRSIRPV